MNQIPLAERIRAERCRGGCTQEELARRLGVHLPIALAFS